jgi:hypothetical protein
MRELIYISDYDIFVMRSSNFDRIVRRSEKKFNFCLNSQVAYKVKKNIYKLGFCNFFINLDFQGICDSGIVYILIFE